MKIRTFGKTADVSWMKGGMFSKSENLKTKCLKEGNVFDGRSNLLHHQIGKELSVLRMELPPCPSKTFSVEYTFLDNLTKPKATFFLPPKEFCESRTSVVSETKSKTNESFTNPISKPPPTTNTTEYSMSRGRERATKNDLEVSDFTFENQTTRPDNALETTTVTVEKSTDQAEETATTLEPTINMGETENVDKERPHHMIARPGRTVGPDNKMGSQQSKEQPGAGPLSSFYLLQIGTAAGVIIGLLLLLLGIVAKKRRSRRRRGVVVMRDGVDENPLYGKLRESDIVEMRDVNTYYAGPLDDDTDDSDGN